MASTRKLHMRAPGIATFGPQSVPHPLGQVDPLPLRMGFQGSSLANAVRALSIDAVAAAQSGYANMPIDMAEVATVLWSRVLRFDATDPRWPDRDRFVLSAGHGSMLLYALLCLTAHTGMDIGALQRFRRLDSPAAGHPEHGEHPAIEVTTGPLGQGLATAVGMALAERMMAARFGRSLVDHRTWVVASDGDLMEGISHEAAGLAGHLRLEKLTVLWNDNSVAIDGGASPSASDDTLRRFAASGWATKRIDGGSSDAAASALSLAMRSKKPTLIACRNGDNRALFGGKPVDEKVADRTKRSFGWPHPPFTIPDDIGAAWQQAGVRGLPARRAWLKRLANHPMRAEFERVIAGRLPELWHEPITALKAEWAETRPAQATGQSSQRALHALADAIPELVGGTADLAGSNLKQAVWMTPVSAGNYGGRYIRFGTREHGMAACLNGMALHGGCLPYAGAFFVSTDYMRPAIRLTALMRQRVIYVLTHDSIGLGQDGPTHQPIEHLASLRAMPDVAVFRPADAIETAECWELAIRRSDGPSLLVLSRQAVPAVRTVAGENRCARGGYVLLEADEARQVTLIASGSEVAVAAEARRLLAEAGVSAAVVSLPCWELFAAQDESYQSHVLGAVLRVGIEAACGFGWERWLGSGGIFVGMRGFGASAPAADLFRHYGITPDAVAMAVKRRLQPIQVKGN